MEEDVKRGRLVIAGVDIKFPLEPYPVQKYMMNQILHALNKTQNCLLESPTGTGKTLGLLCSTLAWQEKERTSTSSIILPEEREKSSDEVPKASTSSNTFQVEERDISPEDLPKGNQEQHCIISSDSEVSDEDIFQAPKRKKKNIETKRPTIEEEKPSKDKEITNQEPLEPQSIEGEKKVFVPTIYYGTRTHKQIDQVVEQLRKTCYVHDVKMTVLAAREHTCINPALRNKPNITDRCKQLIDPVNGGGCTYYHGATKVISHNMLYQCGVPNVFDIEDIVSMGTKKRICPYFTMRNISKTAEIIFCPYNYLIHPDIRESMNISLHKNIVIMDEAHNIEDICRESSTLYLTKDQIAEAIKECKDHCKKLNNVQEYSAIEEYLTKLKEYIETEGSALQYDENNESKNSLSGQFLIDKLHVVGATLEKYNEMVESVSTIDRKKLEDPENHTAISGLVKQVCSSIKCCFKYLYQKDNSPKFAAFFRRHVGLKEASSDSSGAIWFSKIRHTQDEESGDREWKYGLTVLCLDPSLVFKELCVARTIILASGTLSPLDSFKTELGVEFNYVVKGKHVVPPSNLYVSTISSGPSRYELNGVFQHTSSYMYQDELGKVILETAKIVPHGVLCFFQSYTLMDKCRARWGESGLLQELSQVKHVFWEPRKREEMDSVMETFTQTIDETQTSMDITGGVMFGVFRGKIAEGIDFSDDNARVVLAVGIPFSNMKLKEVSLKMEYNTNLFRANKTVLDGRAWYQIQAFRALNQALGRCIRHRNDWGAIIIVDKRFTEKNTLTNLPVWIQSQVKSFLTWPNYTHQLQEFCNRMKGNTS